MEKKILKIPEGTTHIEKGAYRGNTCTYIEFPASLREIGEEAFWGCKELACTILPEKLEKIGARAFYGCAALCEVFIPERVKEIGEEAFSEFGLIYCEALQKPDGWFIEREEYQIEAGEGMDIEDEKMCCALVRTWCGNYRYELTFEEYFSDNEDMRVDPLRKTVWGIQREYIYFLEGNFYFNLPKSLLDLGEEKLGRGMVRNRNPVMKELQDALSDKMERGNLTLNSLYAWVLLYTEVIVDPLAVGCHKEEAAFVLWGMFHYIRQLIELFDSGETFRAEEEKLREQERECYNMLVELDADWETILGMLQQVKFPLRKLAVWIKAYYEKEERWREAHIFALYHELFFGESACTAEEEGLNGENDYNQAVELIRQEDYGKAGELFGRAAKCGHAGGQFNYAITLINGEGCEPDPLQGCYWYWEAAEQGHAKAMMNLAICYRNGQGVLQSGRDMIRWYARAAHELLPEAVYNLGLSLRDEEVIRQNVALGISLIKASDDMQEYESAQEYVKRVSSVILEALS